MQDRIKINLREYKTYLGSKGVSPETIKIYSNLLSKLPPEIIDDPVAIDRYISTQLVKKDGKPYSVGLQYILLCALKRYYDYIGQPELKVKLSMPKLRQQKETKVVRAEDVRLVKKMATPIEKIIVNILYQTGVRRGILCEMTPESIDFNKNTLTIDKKWRGNKGKVTFTKELSPELTKQIHDIIEQKKNKDVLVNDDLKYPLYLKRSKSTTEPIFNFHYLHNDKLHPYYSATDRLTKLIKHIFARAGINAHPHVIRHTVGTLLFEKTKDVVKVKKFLGQKSLAAAERYTHLYNEKEEMRSMRDELIRLGGE